MDTRSLADKALKVAYVNGELISGPEYQKAYRDLSLAMQARYKDMWNENMARMFNLKKRALDNLIDQRLMTQAARRLGLDVTEEEVQKAIMNYPAFQVAGRFDMRRYELLLSQNRMKPEDFEQAMTQDLLDQKLKQFLFAFLNIPEKEVLEAYTFENETVNIAFIPFKAEMFKKAVNLSPSDVAAYYEKHKGDYRVPKKIKAVYIELGPDLFDEAVEITDKEIVSFYEYNIEQYKHPKEVKARHILFKVDEDAADEVAQKARKAAEAVLKKARQGADFAKLAKQYSEGPSSSNGGDLGYFQTGQMDPAFERAAFSLKPGEISDPIRTPFGVHIIKVEDIREARTDPLEAVREKIKETLTRHAATEKAHEKGLLLMDQMPYDIELPVYAKQHDLKVTYSTFFSENEPVTGIEESQKVVPSLFALGKNETSELVELGGKFYIFQVAESKESHIPPLKEVEAQVKKDAASHAARKAATGAASKWLAELKEGKPWDEVAKASGRTPEETGFFSRRDPVPKIGDAPGLKETVFALGPDKRYPEKVFETREGALVIRWIGRKGIDQDKFEEEKIEYREALIQAKHQRVFQNWLESLRKDAEIEIVNDVTG
ncbi:MAG: peptidyl-prolyl cis-trans isomerase [Deltaproteobacteria bacterium]|nr:peptidyl-prolyl cis-trans isomerase [Deltaproteobacteria bacterium]